MSDLVKVLFLVPAPLNISPSQRFRFEHYLNIADKNKLSFVVKPFFSPKAWSILYLKNRYFQKFIGILAGFLRRFITMFTVYKYDYIYIHRDAAILGPPIFEWIIANIYRKKIIYDFDDAIWVKMSSSVNPGAAFLKSTWKVASICKMSSIVTVGNDFLADYARQYCKDVRIIPTVVNTDSGHNRLKNQEEQPITIGWTGTFTNFGQLNSIIPVINELKQKYKFRFLIIADKDPQFNNVDYVYQQWNLPTEIEDLLLLNIGLMPLADNEKEKGKCGFKAIQYMSLGIPAVVSPVGVNQKIVINNENGFWACSYEEWYQKLELLLQDEDLRKQMGGKGRNYIISNYSVQSSKHYFFNIFSK